ncbi:hypothetical protein Clacol_000981 [Clathrus columnatus]|uniref:Uncharacterized protein n=1 Tax=Clathrus columnatus TaxID=1419009 RepID=A0AAV5A1A5_9AGAM|nr:hypothetical protein Clacol_000981 [Clathrus columnatus]
MIKIRIILVALIAPEVIVMWALRQYMAAKEIIEKHKGLTMTHAYFSLMGGFVITDQDQNPNHVLVLNSYHQSHDYFRVLLATVTKVDDDIKARLKILITASIEASITANPAGDKPRRLFKFPGADSVLNGMTATLMTEILRMVLESELLQIVSGHEAAIRLLARNMATEGAKIAWPIMMDEEYENLDAVGERFQKRLRGRLQSRLRLKLPERLRVIKEALEMDIQDRSKQDSLAKTFALAQTTWFVGQCIARRAQHLPLTEIELMTCAYATLSAIIYFFWWYKPFRVNCPIMLRSGIVPPEAWKVDTSKQDSDLWVKFVTFLVGTLYNDRDSRNFIAQVLIAAVFGGIHLFAWNYEFPTRVELWLWRVSALSIVGIPLIVLISLIVLERLLIGDSTPEWILVLSTMYFLPTIVLLYIIARIVILILSIISLRKLPVGTLSNVHWLTFVPHID